MFTDWDPDKGNNGIAGFNFGSFDVGEAKRILRAKPRESVEIRVADYKALAQMVDGVSYSGVDTEVPVILVKRNAGWLPIDGWSRIAKAIREGTETLPAVALDIHEQKRIRQG